MFLTYMHTVFSNAPLSCLEQVQHVWPKYDGILRLEVFSNLTSSPVVFWNSNDLLSSTMKHPSCMFCHVIASSTPFLSNGYVCLDVETAYQNSTECFNKAYNDYEGAIFKHL